MRVVLRQLAWLVAVVGMVSCGGGGGGTNGPDQPNNPESPNNPNNPGGGGGGTVGPAGRGAAPSATGSGVVLHVAKTGSDSSNCVSAPCVTIQRASDLATVAGSVVLVENGDYAGFCAKHPGVTFFGNGDSVRITSEIPSTADGCFQKGRVGINVEGMNDVVIAGFTVTGMSYWGIRVVLSARVVVRNNLVTDNGLAGGDSGILTGFAKEVKVLYNETHDNGEHGIYVSNSDGPGDNPVIRGNVTYRNATSGIQINGDCFTDNDGVTDGKISGAVVDANHVYQNGSKGLSMISAPGVYISNNVIEDNGPAAGGVHLVNEPDCPAADSTIGAVVVNNTIVEPHMAAIRVNPDATGGVIFNNILVSSNPVAFEPGASASVSSTNIRQGSTAGLFAGTGYQLAATSPARDAGEASYQGKSAPTGDHAGVARPKGPKIDLGAYETF